MSEDVKQIMKEKFGNFLSVHNKHLWYQYFSLQHSKTKINIGDMIEQYANILESNDELFDKTNAPISNSF